VAKRKKIKDTTARITFRLGAARGKNHLKAAQGPSVFGILKVFTAVCTLIAVGVGFVFLEKYTIPLSKKTGHLKLLNPPAWVNESLKEKICIAAKTYDKDLKLDENAAMVIQRNIETLVPWMDQVKVQVTHDSIHINGRWRKPLALVESGRNKFYVDASLVVLDYLPMPNLPIINVKGLSVIAKTPSPGKSCRQDDLAAAVTVLTKLDQMDQLVTPKKPLLYEIGSIDVSNFNGRRNNRLPHIVLYAKDNTEVIWGAEFGTWQRHLESSDEEKLAKLYGYYKEYGTLQKGVKYINLCDPQDRIPLPIDKY